MSKYSLQELRFGIGQKCSLVYFGKSIRNVIIEDAYMRSDEEYVVVQTNNSSEGFWARRVISIPIIDKLKNKKLWNLIK